MKFGETAPSSDTSAQLYPFYKIAKKAKVTVLEISKYKFKPQGFTLVALLAESHISFHTFPENGIISFDFFTCGKVSPSVAIDIIKKEFILKMMDELFDKKSEALEFYNDNTPDGVGFIQSYIDELKAEGN